MRFFAVIVICMGMLPACSTLVRNRTSPGLLTIESLRAVKPGAGSAELRKRFGDPSQIAHLNSSEDVWIYNSAEEGHEVQRASFNLDRLRDEVVTATWIPGERDPLARKEGAFQYFKSASFQGKEIGWENRHEYSEEIVYKDPNQGISMWVKPGSNSVIAIGFVLNRSSAFATHD